MFLLAALPGQARVLKGRLFLGRDMQIYLQEDESLVTDLLRSISLVRSEVPVVNLTAAALRPDALAIGTDHKLYAHDPQGFVEAGEVSDYSALKLADGVTLALERDASGAFTGDLAEALTVRVPAGAPHAATAPIATFADWLAELDRLGADLPATKAPPASYVFLFNAIASSLPQEVACSAAAGENFRAFKSWVETGAWTNKAPLEQLLKRVKKDTQVKLVGSKSDGERGADSSRVLQAYEALEAALRSR